MYYVCDQYKCFDATTELLEGQQETWKCFTSADSDSFYSTEAYSITGLQLGRVHFSLMPLENLSTRLSVFKDQYTQFTKQNTYV